MSVYRVSSNKSSVNNFPTVRPTLDLDFANSKTLDPRITFTRSSGGSYVGADGLIKLAGVNEARFDHDPYTGESLGLLIEEARTNLILRSEEFDDASWAKNNCNVTANATTAPDGTLTADKLIAINANTFHDLYKSPGLGSNTYTLSIFAKAAEQSFIQLRIDDGVSSRAAKFNLATERVSSSFNVTSPTITSYPNGWYRCSITFTTNIINAVFNGYPTSSNANYSGDGTSGIFLWGAQIEQGAFPTSYIPTEASTRTRAKELVYIPNVDRTDWYNKAEGTISFEHTTIPVSVSAPEGYPAFGFGSTINGASDQSIQYFITSRFPNAAFLVRDLVAQGGSIPLDQVSIGIPSPANIGAKVSFAYKFNDFGVARNGIFIGRDNTGIVPNNAYMLIIGQNNIDMNQQINAHCKYLKYYPKRLPNSQLQALTK